MDNIWQIIACAVSITSFGYAGWLYLWIKKQPCFNNDIKRIGALIKQGANIFLKREYRTLGYFVFIAAIVIFLFLPEAVWKGNIIKNLIMATAYIAGSVISAIAGKIGILVATVANMRSAEAATKGIKPSFLAGFRGGAVMGMAVVGCSLMGVSAIIILTGDSFAVLGFSFGASSLALFAKAGGGIFTKTADISADLVGKVELGIPEDDPRNPAVIADNVGDNVGDVAGMGADLFDSNVASMAAALVLGISIDGRIGINAEMVFCFVSLGLLSSITGIIFANIKENGDPGTALNKSTYVTTMLYLIFSSAAVYIFNFEWRYWGAGAIGLLVGVMIGIASDYFTNDLRNPVRNVAQASGTGPAFTLLSGMSYGLLSTLPSLAGIAVSALAAFSLCNGIDPGSMKDGLFGIAVSAIGMLSIVGMIISNDAYGPIVDNARGLVEMSGLGEEALKVTDKLDSAGNTVKAITKGFAIGAAGLTVISLLGAFLSEVNEILSEKGLDLISGFDIMDPQVFFGMLIGLSLPAVFSALLILGVDKNARRLVKEIRRQFIEIPGLKEGKKNVLPDYDKCIDIAASGALKELIPAGLICIIVTLIVGFTGGVEAIGGFLAGNIMSGLLLALFMSNSGGLWDNAKKLIEAGNYGGKNSLAHKSAVVGDTVGDPFKDTAGPSLNTQITVVSLVSSLSASLFIAFSLF